MASRTSTTRESRVSLIIQAHLLDRYGPRLDCDALGKVLGVEKKTVQNKAAANTLGIKTYVDGGKRWVDVRDVAEYFDACRANAR